MFPFITKENFCKKVLLSKGISVDRYISNEGMLKRILNYYCDQYQDFNIGKSAESFLRSMSEMPIEYCIIKYLGRDDAGVLDVINCVFTIDDLVGFITDTINQERNILNLGKIYSKLLDSAIKDDINLNEYNLFLKNVEVAADKLISLIVLEAGTDKSNREEKLYHYLTEDLHFDFYFDYLEEIPHSYNFVKKVMGEELALKVFRNMLIFKKRAIKNQDWSWKCLYRKHKQAIDAVILWMGDSSNTLTKDDKQLKRLFFDIIINNRED